MAARGGRGAASAGSGSPAQHACISADLWVLRLIARVTPRLVGLLAGKLPSETSADAVPSNVIGNRVCSLRISFANRLPGAASIGKAAGALAAQLLICAQLFN